MDDRQNELILIEQEVAPIENKISALVISDERSSKLATDYGAYVSTVIKRADELRKAINEPYERYIKENNAKFYFITKLKELKEAIRQKIMAYIEEDRIRQVKETEEKQKKMDEMAKKNGLPEVKIEVEEKRKITSGIGKSFTQKRWAWKVEDMNKIPKEYFVLDESKINGLVKAHTKTIKGVSTCDLAIEGIKIFQKEDVSFRR